MALNQLTFVFLFLPLLLLVYRLLPERAKEPALLVFSVIFVSWGNPADLLYLAAAIVFNYCTAREMTLFLKKGRKAAAKAVLISGILADAVLLGYFKYINFFRSLLGMPEKSVGLAVPVGISFVTFSLISFLVDIYRRSAPMTDLFRFSLFVTFFPKMGSGPIVTYHDFLSVLRRRRETPAAREAGISRFIIGLFKKTVIAGNLNLLFAAVTAAPQRSVLSAWLGALGYAFMLYFDFAGYSDMAVGIGRMMGFILPENFNDPYLSAGISDFWRRWHITLGMFFRNYVYIPLGGNRKGKGRTILNLFVVWLLTGIWHGANFTFLVWGVYHFVLIVLEKFVFSKPWLRLPKPLRVVVNFLAVTVGWVFFFSDSLASAVAFLGNMAGVGAGAGSGGYYLLSFCGLLALSVFLCSPLPGRITFRLREKKCFRFARYAGLLALMLLCVASLIGDSYTSFLYAAF